MLIDINVNGRAIKAVASPSKQGWLYVFDRVTGQPVWPIEERPVPQSDVPGEKTSPTQPFPTKPPAYARNYLKVPDDLIDFTPELRAQALERLKRYKSRPSPFTPPMLGNVNGPLYGALGRVDGDQLARLWRRSGNRTSSTRRPATWASSARSLVAPPKGFSDIGYVSGIAGENSAWCSDRATAARLTRRSGRRADGCRRGAGAPLSGRPAAPRTGSTSRACRS